MAEIEGLGELLRTLEALPREIVSVKGGPVRVGLRKAGQVWPSVTSGTAKGAVIVSRDPNPQRSGANERVLVRLRRKARAPNGASVHAYVGTFEFGNEQVPAKPVFRPVVPQKSSEALNVFISETRKAIDRAVKKARRK
jgi:hypothetical protein